MKFIFSALVFSLLFLPVSAFAYQEDLDGLLKAYVKPIQVEGMHYHGVDYDAWSQDKRHAKVRKAIQRKSVDGFDTKTEELAFWINAYNFFIIDLIIQKGERDSIQDLKGIKSPWERYNWSVDGKIYTLKKILDEHIRIHDDPRVHFALSCAAKSCPDLRMEAYDGKNLDRQLSIQTKKFLQNKTKGFNVTDDKNIVQVSSVFKEHADDFNRGNIKSWLQPYFKLFITAVTKITYFDFDWSLNSQPK